MIAPAPLDQLVALDRTWLHLFVTGPGVGEGIAIALPERGWMLFDGSETDGESAFLAILKTWRGDSDPIDCLTLTHSHQDHAMAFRQVLEEAQPTKVALTGPPDAPIEGTMLAPPVTASTTARRLRRRPVQEAMLAIHAFHGRSPGALIGICEGVALPCSSSAVAVVARSPGRPTVDAALAIARLGGDPGDFNELSTAFEVQFGETRIVLGSDLKTAGWHHAVASRPELGQHQGLKVPHHGSSTSHHLGLMTTGTGRAWIVAPFSPSRLPVHDDGIPWLVGRNGSVLVTAAPLARDRQPLPRPEVRLRDVAAMFVGTAPPGKRPVVISPPHGLHALDAVWAAAFDDKGAIRGLWRGPRSFTVVPDEDQSPPPRSQ